MKKISLAALLVLALIFVFMSAVQAQSPQETLNQYISDLQKNPNDNALREKIIKLVQTMKPAPAIPEEAKKHMARGMAAFESAKNEQEYKDAISESEKAVGYAPWLGEGYRNLGIVQDKAGHFDAAIMSLKLYLLTNPSDAEKAKELIYKIEFRKEKEVKVKKKEKEEKEAAFYTDPTTGMEMVRVKGGCFQMGDTFGDGESDEKPVHEVCVDDFYIGKYEVTQGQWKAIMWNNPSDFKDCGDNCPVERVSWNDIQDFINKLNQKMKDNPQAPFIKGEFRLPTEAEWEYTARSGGKNEKYSGGNDIDSVAWYTSNSGSKTHPVGQKAPNGLGIYDMSGNVWEWVNDRYSSSYYSESPRNNPKGPNSSSDRVIRGGSWFNLARCVRASYRFIDSPDYRGYDLGFRLAGSK